MMGFGALGFRVRALLLIQNLGFMSSGCSGLRCPRRTATSENLGSNPESFLSQKVEIGQPPKS